MQLISLCLVFGHQKMICYCGFHVHIESNATNHQPTVNSFINQYTVLHLEAQRQITQRILRLCWRFIFKLILMTSAWRVIHPSASALYNYLRYCVANFINISHVFEFAVRGLFTFMMWHTPSVCHLGLSIIPYVPLYSSLWAVRSNV